jgi:ORF6N domain
MPHKKKLTISSPSVSVQLIERRIYLIRGQKVMIDTDLAELYGEPTKRINQQVQRNIERFPEDFMFQLSKTESESLGGEVVAHCLMPSLSKASRGYRAF